MTDEAVAIHIRHRAKGGGLGATLAGPRARLTNRALLRSALRRPFGTRRALVLIHWQALRLALKGARYRQRPAPPARHISREGPATHNERERQMQIAILYAVTAAVFLGLDAIGLTYHIRPVVERHVGHLLVPSFRLLTPRSSTSATPPGWSTWFRSRRFAMAC